MSDVRPSESARMVGAVLNGKWRLTRLLGEGGMGAVFSATNHVGGGVCAIKILHREFSTDERVTARFFGEAEATSRLQHPGIVRVFEAAKAEDGTPYLVMELLEGRSLASYLATRQPMPVSDVLAFGRAILEAIAFAHGHGVVHRDLKPENVFVRVTPSGIEVKILDFGLAKVMDAAGGMGSRTRTGMLLGTPGYMSPEQIANPKTVDRRSDLYGIGVMLFEMLTGAEPFPSENPFEKLTKVLSSEPPRMSAVAPALAAFDDFFLRALARDRDARFSSADEMAAALARASAAGAALVAPTSVRPSRPEHTTQMSQVAPIATPPPRPAIAPGQVQVVSLPPPPPPSVAKKTAWPLVLAIVAFVCTAVGVAIGWFLARG